MFRGNNTAKVDDKGRLKIPSAFVALLEAANVKQVFITSTDGKSAQIWPLPEWEKHERQLVEKAYMNDVVEKYLELTSFYGQQVELDSQSRVVLPQRLRDKAKVGPEAVVMVLGKLNHMDVWNEKDCEANMQAAVMTAEDRKEFKRVLTSVASGQ